MQRRKYLEGLASACGIVTVTPTGEVLGPDDDRSGSAEPKDTGRKSVIGLSCPPIQPVNVGIIGLGNRGSHLTRLIDEMYPDKAEIKAICDIVEERVEEMRSELQQEPDIYSAGVSEDEWVGTDEWKQEVPTDEPVDDTWKEVVERDDLDLVFVFTNLGSHAPMCTYIMEQGKHAATEVAAAETIEQCWNLVKTAEKERKHCMMLEQVNYFEEEMWVLNMIKNGVFGDKLTYAKGSYLNYGVQSYLEPERRSGADMRYGPPVNWRARRHHNLKGDLYPTHGQGPLAWYMDILRGDHYDYLVAEESVETRFSQRSQELDPDHEFYGETDWPNGDTTRSLIKTKNGQSIEIQFDIKTNRPYSLGNEIAGVDAFFNGYQVNQDQEDLRSHLAVDEEADPGLLDEETYDAYQEQYEHPLWSDDNEEINSQGADFIMLYRLIDALNEGRPLDQDVYDAATWSAVNPLSRISIEQGGKPVKFPDFTRGRWDEERELEVMKS